MGAEKQTPHGLADWLVSLDRPGSEERKTVTLSQIIDAAKEALSSEQEQQDEEGHRIEVTWDGSGLGFLRLQLHHPEEGCDPGEEGRPGTCWLDGWLENSDEPEASLRGKVTLPVASYELDGDQPVFHLQSPQPQPLQGDGEQ